MTKYCRLNGQKCDGKDPQRGVWYSYRCRYWTDDWSKLKLVGPGIPSCPCCGSVGYQATFMEFKMIHEGDWEQTEKSKEKCNDHWKTCKPGQDMPSTWLPEGS